MTRRRQLPHQATHQAHQRQAVPPPDEAGPPLTLTARTPEDLLAAVPVVLGFHPTHSVVMLTFGGRERFHARLDLPADDVPLTAELLDELAQCLRVPATQHGVTRVVLVLYAADHLRSRRIARSLADDFRAHDIEVVEMLRADAGRWFGLGGHREVPAAGVPYDTASHAFTAESVLDGRVTLASRADLADTLISDPAGVALVEAELERQLARRLRLFDAAAVGAVVGDHLASGRFSDRDLVRVLLAIQVPNHRDGAWEPINGATAAHHVRLWTDACRRAPEPLLPSAAAVLAFAAWQAGHGALAWCALDLCRSVDPENTLADLVTDLLDAAVPPSFHAARRSS